VFPRCFYLDGHLLRKRIPHRPVWAGPVAGS
jgi:hypothetical protein